MEQIEDHRKNPYYKLEPDEEFSIKNYRLIRQKKDTTKQQDVVAQE